MLCVIVLYNKQETFSIKAVIKEKGAQLVFI